MVRGERVWLRPVERDDLPYIEAWKNDPDVIAPYNMFGLHPMHGDMEQGFNERGLLDERMGMLLIVTLDGERAGDVSYHQERYGPNTGSIAYNIGINLLPAFRGRGLGVEAQQLLAAYLFATYPIMRVEAATDATNIPEQRALEKAGFTREGVFRSAQWRGGAWHDLVVYSKLRGE
jgi:RimJ/RimL family protein N-acetyltransferase